MIDSTPNANALVDVDVAHNGEKAAQKGTEEIEAMSAKDANFIVKDKDFQEQ